MTVSYNNFAYTIFRYRSTSYSRFHLNISPLISRRASTKRHRNHSSSDSDWPVQRVQPNSEDGSSVSICQAVNSHGYISAMQEENSIAGVDKKPVKCRRARGSKNRGFRMGVVQDRGESRGEDRPRSEIREIAAEGNYSITS